MFTKACFLLVLFLGSVCGSAIQQYRRLRLHEDLFVGLDLNSTDVFDPELLPVIEASKRPDAQQALLEVVQQEAVGIYSFPFFSERFCERFLDELDNYYRSGLPIRRPNSMNNYGIIVNEIGVCACHVRPQPYKNPK